ncbi:rare lipoprotein A [Colwellia chukchiensis]|uniref:Endolytic peptidoglycan transglycosylase RlpA n=1 Tax=Colwellia chukchiensis TaxID=641665 RepID=A0A1H7H653_9GAMM|nr:septal ring lytic transglycosylase RlpA family protein [Colwellia chukchiensis]SEK44772.1 rare lipoprotein A [Colwellia chukchiensis]
MAKLNLSLLFSLGMLLTFISACSTTSSRYQQKHDSIPSRLPSASELHDATPRAEAPSRGGNKPYQVFGQHYQVLASAENFSESGIASWYGKKFHGHLTSNGEIYDMYAMSAAHKHLPLPSYVLVTNNDNDRSVIVRVNDRGPFHQNRIIDLSYSAAYKLGMLKTGTANVTIKAITDFSAQGLAQIRENKTTKVTQLTRDNDLPTLDQTTQAPALATPINHTELAPFIQVFANSSQTQADKLAKQLTAQYHISTELVEKNGIFRVLMGPIKHQELLNTLLSDLKRNGHPQAFVRR